MAGIYIHIPFCKQACTYCNFYFSTSLGNKDAFLKALLKEVELTKEYLEGKDIETIYIGGGTPSILSVTELSSIIEAIAKHYNISQLKEFTIEANPDDLNKGKVTELKTLKSIGLNRFSIGVQSFFDADLKYMNRAHNANEALTSIKHVQDAGFENITLDLIYGTPTMPDDAWIKNLHTAFELNVPHISSYALTVEPKTTLDKRIQTKAAQPVSDEQTARQFNILMDEMEKAGYDQYEISNFGKPGKYAVHNSNYWRGKKYLGLGPSAHSFNLVSRRWNVANNVNYINAINKGELNYEEEVLTAEQSTNEKIMTSLRTIWGLNLSELGGHATLIRKTLETIDPSLYIYVNDTITLTKSGRLFADKIAATLFV